MAFNLFGLLPDPDEAYKNAPQLPLNMELLNSYRKDLVGLDDRKKESLRDQYQSSIGEGRERAEKSIRNSGTNASVAVASNDRLNENVNKQMTRAEQDIQNKDMMAEDKAKERFRQEYTRIDQKKDQNKIARETARADADLARKSGLANIVGKVAGIGISEFMFKDEEPVDGVGGGGSGGGKPTEPSKDKVANKYVDDANKNSKAITDVAPDADTIFSSKGVEELLGSNSDFDYTHRVSEGDTLGGIATQFGVSVDELAKYNSLDDPNSLAEGQLIKIW